MQSVAPHSPAGQLGSARPERAMPRALGPTEGDRRLKQRGRAGTGEIGRVDRENLGYPHPSPHTAPSSAAVARDPRPQRVRPAGHECGAGAPEGSHPSRGAGQSRPAAAGPPRRMGEVFARGGGDLTS